MKINRLGWTLLALACAAAAPVPTSTQLPSTDDIQSLIDGKQYTTALSRLHRLLDLKGPSAEPYDRHTLEMLRAECQLQMRSMDEALRTLAAAQAEAAKQTDVDEAAALVTLLHRASRYTYTPKGKDGKALDILDKDQRKQAFESLWTDARATAEAAPLANTHYTTMGALLADAEQMETDRGFEFMATGKTATTDKWARTLHDKATTLLNSEISKMTSTVDQIARRASSTTTVSIPGAGMRTLRVGLSRADAQTLDGVQSTARDFGPAMTKMGQYFVADAQTFKGFTDKAVAAGNKASQVEHATY